ncbi:MAG: Stk1 family PASTA domain-containing Ser/Thr kinase [Acidimicrobiales bacterium]
MEPSTTPRVLSGRYELAHLVARGGMAEVYRAHDRLLDRPVALKVLFPELSVDRAFVERFRREAQAAANLSHPNIVPVFDWGEDSGTYYIVMEFIDGRPLSSILRTAGPLHPDRAADIAADVAGALAYAHRHGVIHRDVKPGNVLITDEGQVKVTDFGIARAINTEESLTQTGAVMGTATYFSPEQAEGMGVDSRSDIYSLGVVLYEMVTGRPPFLGDTPVAVASKHVREHPPAPREINPSVPLDLEAIILKCMAKSPDYRYATGEDLRVDLLRFREGRSVAATALQTTAIGAALEATQAIGAITRTQALPQVPGAGGPPGALGSRPAGEGQLPPGEDDHSRTGIYVTILLVLLAALAVVVAFLGNSLGWWHFSSSNTSFSMPSVTGMPASQAVSTLHADGLVVHTQKVSSSKTVGTVVRTSPGASAKVHKGQIVTLYVSKGHHSSSPPITSQVTVPDEKGKTLSTAEADVVALGLKYKAIAVDSSAPANQVTSQSPSSGTPVATGATITFYYSNGTPPPAATIAVPDVSGDDTTTASNALGQAGICVSGQTTQSSSVYASGYVINTNPPGGTQVKKGACVQLVVSSGPSQVPVQDVVGDSQSVAETTLTKQGFTPVVQKDYTTCSSDVGIVLAQNPTGGTPEPSGSSVTITVGSSNPADPPVPGGLLSGCSTGTTPSGSGTGTSSSGGSSSSTSSLARPYPATTPGIQAPGAGATSGTPGSSREAAFRMP